ncbi:aminotransferase class V-fold PLP-dependent enzyme [Rhizobium puerariae]|uniref:Aminotransferase class V-fold PLP-dependent enzyme n=1 Tax=Rhizobium puerariae TaxID=1585791 RepID=A0ABV6ACN7_9HYPH
MRERQTIRADLPALARLTYLNTGTAGPLPVAVADAMHDALKEDVERGRISGRRYAKIDAMLATLRETLAGLFGAAPNEVVLTSGTVDGLEIVLDRISLSPGQRVVTTDLEHPAALDLLHHWAARRSVDVVAVGIAGRPDEEAIRILADALETRAGLLLVSHVGWASGRVLPIAGLAARARKAGVPILVDGAQAAGSIDIDFAALGVDFYALPGQKWLLGPEGTGVLLVARGSLERLAGHGPVPEAAITFERGAKSKQLWAGLAAALAWRTVQGDHRELLAAGREMAAGLRRELAKLPGVSVATPAHAAGLVAFSLAGHDPADVVAALGARRIAVRDIPGTDLIRASCAFFTTPDDIAALTGTIVALASEAAQ